jgi:hypothetical protein
MESREKSGSYGALPFNKGRLDPLTDRSALLSTCIAVPDVKSLR